MTNFDWSSVTHDEQMLLLTTFNGDGHSIWPRINLENAGVSDAVINHFQQFYASDFSAHQSTIHINDQPIAGMYGVHGLTVLESLARYHAIQSHALGRGFRARDLTEQIKEKLSHATT